MDLPQNASVGFNMGDASLSFFAIILEGSPFILMGAILSGLIDLFLPTGLIKNWLPRSKIQGGFLAILTGFLLPFCECGAMPVVQRLIRKGITPSVATTYLLSAPALNPLALFTTWLAFQNQNPWQMVGLRLGFSLIVLLYLNTWLSRLRPDQILRPELLLGTSFNRTKGQTPLPPEIALPSPGFSLGGLQQFTGAVIRDFIGVLPFLVLGAAVAALFSTGINRAFLIPIGQNPVLGPLAGILLSQMLCLCSTTDAFIISTFSPFAVAAKIAFLVAGPLIDLKLYWLYRSAFTTTFVHQLWIRALTATFLLTLIYSILFHH